MVLSFNKTPPSYTFSEWVFITAAVTDASAQAVSRAAVELEIITASGLPVLQSGSTNRSGLVTFALLTDPVQGEGTYSVTATATKSELSGSGTAEFTVFAVAPSCEVCSFNEAVAITLVLFSNGSPLENASVTVDILTPSGVVLSGGGVADVNGEVILSFTPVRSFGAGTYVIQARGGTPWYTFGYYSTFTVQ